jgi:hypothetical protein
MILDNTTLPAPGRTIPRPRAIPRFVRAHPDVPVLFGLAALTLLTAWNRAVFDGWLLRFDLFTQIIPWYAYLGERLRAGDIPGWNPHQLSGTPFAGHPLSGWMYLPAMAIFPLFPALTAFKVFMAAHVLLASVSSYAYARVLGFRILAALVAACAFAFGPFLEWTTYTSLQFAQFAVWVPLALLGIELSFQRRTWRSRLLPGSIAALAFSQMLAGWVGEGWIYAVLLLGTYTVYRGLSALPPGWEPRKERFWHIVGTSCLVLGWGAALGAAGVLPRLVANAQTNIAGGDYSKLGAGGVLNPPWTPGYLVTQLLGAGEGYHFRAAGFGGAVTVLALFALILTPRRLAVPYFALLTGVALVLTLSPTPLHQAFYVMHGYQELHEHDPWRVIALVSIGPAILSGAAVHALLERSRSLAFVPLIVATGGLVSGVALALAPADGLAWWAPGLAAFAVMLLAVTLLLDRAVFPDSAWWGAWGPPVLSALILGVVFLQPAGLELSGSWLGWPHDPRWTERWEQDPAVERALAVEFMQSDPQGAGAFLQEQLLTEGPFRYLGYGGVGHPDGGWLARTYMDRRFDSDVQAILVNGRPLMLGLYEVQGYDPVQLSRYVSVIRAVNGKGQDYHTAFISDEGVDSPLLDMLDIRYVLVPDTLPLDRPDVARLIQNCTAVYRGSQVTVYERQPNPSHAWIVHDVQTVAPGAALDLIADGSVDLYQTALIEGSSPQVDPVKNPEGDRAHVSLYESERIQIQTQTSVPSFLVISEMYADGWSATVNGAAATLSPTNHALQGVAIPAGEATIELLYEPRSLQVGTLISGAAALALILVIIDAAYRYGFRRSRGHASTP